MKTAKQILRKARKIILSQDYLPKGQYASGGCYCALGAINMAAHGAVVSIGAPTEAFDAREAFEDIVGTPITDFNDAPETTKEDVALAMLYAERSLP